MLVKFCCKNIFGVKEDKARNANMRLVSADEKQRTRVSLQIPFCKFWICFVHFLEWNVIYLFDRGCDCDANYNDWAKGRCVNYV